MSATHSTLMAGLTIDKLLFCQNLMVGGQWLVAGGWWLVVLGLDILWSLWKYLYTMIRLFNAVGHVSDLCLCQWTYQELDQSRTQGIGCTLCQKEGSGCDEVRGHMERMH